LSTRITCLIFVLLASSQLAHGDLIANYSAGTDLLTLSYRDDQRIRVDRRSGGYTVINGPRAVAVLNQGAGNMVLDANQLAVVLGGLGESQGVSIPDTSDVRLVDTGAVVVVAGFSGKVFHASDGRGTYRLVLSDNPQVIAASDALRHFFRRFAVAMGNAQGARILALDTAFRDHPYRGLLHVEGGVKLESIGQIQRADSYYQIPATALNFSLPGLPR